MHREWKDRERRRARWYRGGLGTRRDEPGRAQYRKQHDRCDRGASARYTADGFPRDGCRDRAVERAPEVVDELTRTLIALIAVLLQGFPDDALDLRRDTSAIRAETL